MEGHLIPIFLLLMLWTISSSSIVQGPGHATGDEGWEERLGKQAYRLTDWDATIRKTLEQNKEEAWAFVFRIVYITPIEHGYRMAEKLTSTTLGGIAKLGDSLRKETKELRESIMNWFKMDFAKAIHNLQFVDVPMNILVRIVEDVNDMDNSVREAFYATNNILQNIMKVSLPVDYELITEWKQRHGDAAHDDLLSGIMKGDLTESDMSQYVGALKAYVLTHPSNLIGWSNDVRFQNRISVRGGLQRTYFLQKINVTIDPTDGMLEGKMGVCVNGVETICYHD